MIIVVAAGEEVQHRHILWIKRSYICREIGIFLERDIEPRCHISLLNEAPPRAGRADPLEAQLVLPEPADHIKIDVRDDIGQRHGWLLDEVGGSNQADL